MDKSKVIPVVVAAALATAGCENLTPGENAAVFGGLTGAATGIALGASGVDSSIAIPVTAGAAVAGGAAAYIVSKQRATAKQKAMAEENARKAMAKLESKPRASGGTKAKKPRFIAVDTVADAGNPKGTKQVMVYDTQSQEIVGNNVYNVGKTPGVGSTNRYDTVSAQYVGTGRSL